MKKQRGDNEFGVAEWASMLAGGAAIRVLAATWRYRIVGGESLLRLREERTPFIFALWHGEMLPLLWHHRNEGVAALVSEHNDGELIAQVIERMGYKLVRGSTSRGGGRALLGVVRALKEGDNVAITPDGPRGPRHKFAPGALIAANRAEAPILPIVAHVDRFWQLASWDGFIIPKPFARITVGYGPATRMTSATPREAAEQVPLLEQIMSETHEKACA